MQMFWMLSSVMRGVRVRFGHLRLPRESIQSGNWFFGLEFVLIWTRTILLHRLKT